MQHPDFDVKHHSPPTRPDREHTEGPADPVIEAMVCELHTAALKCAVVGSVVNAAGPPGAGGSPSELLSLIPGETIIGVANTRSMLESGMSPMVLLAVHDFMSELEPARAVMQRYAVDAALLGIERAHVLHRLLLIDTWRRHSQLALEAVDLVERDLSGRLPSAYSDSARVLNDLLLEVEKGGSPCLGANDRIIIPVLPQRRRSSRRTLLQNCTLIYRNRAHRAFVQNISCGGLGLSRTPTLLRGEAVTVELHNGRRFSGSIVWSSGPFAGMRFTVPLSHRDPLLV